MFWHTILETIKTNAFARNLLLTETYTYLLDQTFVRAFRLPTQDVFVVCMEPHIDITLYRICFVLAESWPTRTSFSSLYETRTHPFGVDATETDYRFRNHYTWWYKILLSLELLARLTGCLLLELRYLFHFIIGLASRIRLHITEG